MITFLMTGTYTPEALRGISTQRTEKAIELIKQHEGQVKAMYATLGQNDLVFILDFPGMKDAMKASAAMSKLTGIAFNTCPAVSVEAFDALLAEG